MKKRQPMAVLAMLQPENDGEKIFPGDKMSRRQRVEATLRHQPVDRTALLEQLSYNPNVIADWTARTVTGFDYSVADICDVIRRTMDLVMPPVAPRGTGRVTSPDGFVVQNDNWTSWRVSRPFDDETGACAWLRRQIVALKNASFDPSLAREKYHRSMLDLQSLIGQTVILNYSHTGFCNVFDRMGLELFTFFQLDHPEVLAEFMEISTAHELRRIHSVADPGLSPVILIAEDFSTKHGPLFSPEFLREFHYPYIRQLVHAWHEHGLCVLYHSDGNYRRAIPDLIACGVDGFYCLEPNCGMDIVDLKTTWPQMVWAGGVDGVDLLERGAPQQVRAEVHRHIIRTDALNTGGMFVASSSEISPTIPPENFRAMVEAVGNFTNPCFAEVISGDLPQENDPMNQSYVTTGGNLISEACSAGCPYADPESHVVIQRNRIATSNKTKETP